MEYLPCFIIAYAIIGISAGLIASFSRKQYFHMRPNELSHAQRAVRDGHATPGDRLGLFLMTLVGCAISPLHAILIIVLSVIISFVF